MFTSTRCCPEGPTTGGQTPDMALADKANRSAEPFPCAFPSRHAWSTRSDGTCRGSDPYMSRPAVSGGQQPSSEAIGVSAARRRRRTSPRRRQATRRPLRRARARATERRCESFPNIDSPSLRALRRRARRGSVGEGPIRINTLTRSERVKRSEHFSFDTVLGCW